MKLSQKNYYEYLNTHLNLLYFVGYYTDILDEKTEFEDFLKMSFKEKAICREAFLEDKDQLLDVYINNSFEIPEEQLSILEGFRKSINGKFVLLKCFSGNAIFKSIDNGYFYAVNSLSDPFEELIPEYPTILELNILPFKGQIIYDGFIKGGNIKTGTNIKKSLLEEYKQAKKNKEIITTLD
ncbi:hypothetical protein OX284_011520 [Flavobacterium sp. SUN046]|uniref:hypothetical protein n=1 Tax=Flavobacterium sp. SUN046 TaxID=3002440 RepID=UPI002DB6ED1F|nr:hypothetical protein [Flavobacterium sp. SUN046]MEC4050061.1 hypothetical protein [Flavobacterium sp. SUN046]